MQVSWHRWEGEQAPTVILDFTLLVGPGRPWSAIVGYRWGFCKGRKRTNVYCSVPTSTLQASTYATSNADMLVGLVIKRQLILVCAIDSAHLPIVVSFVPIIHKSVWYWLWSALVGNTYLWSALVGNPYLWSALVGNPYISGRPWSALVGTPPIVAKIGLVGPGRPWSALVGPGQRRCLAP